MGSDPGGGPDPEGPILGWGPDPTGPGSDPTSDPVGPDLGSADLEVRPIVGEHILLLWVPNRHYVTGYYTLCNNTLNV